jgi:hypothetical protein
MPCTSAQYGDLDRNGQPGPGPIRLQMTEQLPAEAIVIAIWFQAKAALPAGESELLRE